MRKNLFVLFALFAIIGWAVAPAAAQDTQCPTAPAIGSAFQNTSGGNINTRIAPTRNGATNQYGSIPSGGTVVVDLAVVTPECDIWVHTTVGWAAVRFNGTDLMALAAGDQLRALVAQTPIVNGIQTGSLLDAENNVLGHVFIPQTEVVEILVPEGGISFFAAARVDQPNNWYVEVMVGATFTDNDVDEGRIESFEVDRNARTVAVVFFNLTGTGLNQNDLQNAFVSELFALGATSVTVGSNAAVTAAQASTFEFEFAVSGDQMVALAAEGFAYDASTLPYGVSPWGPGWNYSMNRETEVLMASGYTNWFAGNATTVTIGEWSEWFGAGEQGETFVFLMSNDVTPVEFSDFNRGASSFNALEFNTGVHEETGELLYEELPFTMANVASLSSQYNCGDGCEHFLVVLIDPDRPEATMSRKFDVATATEANMAAFVREFETALRQ